MDRASQSYSMKVEDLKKRNLDRFENVANRLQNLAEQERKDHLEKLKKKKKML